MSSAILRHASPLLNIRAPIIAGIATAGVMIAGLALVAIFGKANLQLPAARGELEPAAIIEPVAHDTGLREDPADHADTIRFVETDDGAEASLDGVGNGFSHPAPAPTEGSDPAAAEAALSAAHNPNALAVAPLPGLHEPGPGGVLPVIGPNGFRPSRAYARPFHGDPTAPTLALIIGGMGLNSRVTEAAINELPPEVALSFAPYTADLQSWIDRARAAGHEVLIEAPMEPYDYPNNDPGPHTLLADGPSDENNRRLVWILSRTTGYFAVTNYLGARFSASDAALSYLFDQLEGRGIAFLHDGTGRRATVVSAATRANIEYAIADRILDDDPSPATIDSRLLAIEALALQNGSALGAGFAYPATVTEVSDWARNLDARGYQLAPPSAIMARRRLEAIAAAEAAANEPAAPARTQASASDSREPAASSGH
jgi:polysaccharide deacetylase 2 family uncharacterized protein YibQ